jgi:protein-S-isoprenylcysteine O-methyltransferase Ste14
MTVHWTIVCVSWVVFWVFWAIAGLRRRPPARSAPIRFTVLNTAVLYVGFVLVLLGRSGVGPIVVPNPFGIVATFGAACAVVGVGLAIWSRWLLGTNWSVVVRISEGQQLVRRGPYAVVRHPIYSGIALAIFGSALVSGTVGNLVGFVCVVASLWQKARLEERFLLEAFGAAYAAYRDETKFLIPFIV